MSKAAERFNRRAILPTELRAEGDGATRWVEAVASSQALDACGAVFTQEALAGAIPGYTKQAARPCLWAHQAQVPALGQIEDLRMQGGEPVYRARWAPEGVRELADTIFGLIGDGVINCTSIGFSANPATDGTFDRETGGFCWQRVALAEVAAAGLADCGRAGEGATVARRAPEAQWAATSGTS